MTKLFRTQFVLMALGSWDYGEHVSDPRAFAMRLGKVLAS